MTRRDALRLALVIGTMSHGGAERVLSLLANAWADKGHDITLITLDGSKETFFPLHNAVTRHTVAPRVFCNHGKLQSVFILLRQALDLRRLLSTYRSDLVLSFIDAANVMTLLAQLGRQEPVIVAERSDPAMVPLSPVWRALRKLLYRRAACVVVQTEGAAAFFHRWPIKRLAVVPNPVTVPREVDDSVSLIVRRPAIVSVGRFSEEKRFCDLIEAYSQIAQKHPNWSLVIFGDGPLRSSLQRQINDLKLGHRVELAHPVRNIAIVLKQADIFVLSSRFEGFPNALCEAMALGRPVVSTDCPSGPRAIVRNEVDGLLVAPRDPASLAMTLERLVRRPEERYRLGTAARTIVQRFPLVEILARWEILFSEARAAPAAA